MQRGLKEAFLKYLAGPSGKTKYKRYAATPLRYAGCKTLAVGLILELIPENTMRIISPFIGGGSAGEIFKLRHYPLVHYLS